MRYAPAALVIVRRLSGVSRFSASTIALATGLPAAPRTVPSSVIVSCAAAGVTADAASEASAATRPATRRRMVRMTTTPARGDARGRAGTSVDPPVRQRHVYAAARDYDRQDRGISRTRVRERRLESAHLACTPR